MHLTPASSLALPLLHNLLQEPLGHRFPLPLISQLFVYVSKFSANQCQDSGANFDDVVMGAMMVYQSAQLTSSYWSAIPYFSISISLDLILTLMIVIRLVVYARNTRTAMGITGVGGLCKAIVTMLIESSIIYAVNSLLFIVPWVTKNYADDIFLPILGQAQVRSFP